VGDTGWGISVLLELVLLFLFLISREVAFVFDFLIVGDFSLRNRSSRRLLRVFAGSADSNLLRRSSIRGEEDSSLLLLRIPLSRRFNSFLP